MSFAPARGGGPRPGGWRASFRKPLAAIDPTTTTTAPPLGDLLDKICLPDLEKSASDFKDTAVIRDPVTVASFNWMRATNPTIVIPGSPPRWSPPNGLTQLREDQGDFFRDRNAAQYPQHPMEPAIVAGIHANSNLARDIHIVACSSTLGNLLRFVRRQEKSFRILVELIDKTLFLIRRENSPTELIQGVRGYGHTFPEAYTTWDPDVKKSTSHQRLLRYNFGGLDLLVRFEADGYLPASSNEVLKPLLARAKASEHFDVEDLTNSFNAAKVQIEESPTIPPSGKSKLAVEQAGEAVSQDRIFDLKTRSLWKKNQDLLNEEIPRLWVAQISNFVIAYHEKGIFKPENIEIRSIKQDVAKWESDQSSVLTQLVALLHILISKAHKQKDGRFEIRRSEGGEIELRRQLGGAGETLSLGVKEAWTQSSRIGLNGGKVDTTKDVADIFSWDDSPHSDYTACTSACHYCGFCTY
ncbi:hypothetical protein BGZ60DRAFT_391872 [Tricladium varicosporioides]|nr:hypothetical protein BGZ60DRAFT_391872 [Hymenoscyphus varicosporioides]